MHSPSHSRSSLYNCAQNSLRSPQRVWSSRQRSRRRRWCLSPPWWSLRLQLNLTALDYIALIEYVASMAPFIYVAYLAARLHLPNNVYFPRVDADGDGSSDALWLVFENALLYAGLELLSFVELNAIVHRAFGFLSIILLQFQLEHFGDSCAKQECVREDLNGLTDFAITLLHTRVRASASASNGSRRRTRTSGSGSMWTPWSSVASMGCLSSRASWKSLCGRDLGVLFAARRAAIFQPAEKKGGEDEEAQVDQISCRASASRSLRRRWPKQH